MSVRSRLEAFRDQGLLPPERAEALLSVERGDPFSVHGEVRAFYYFGALLAAAGAGMTVQRYVEIGPAAVLGALSAAALACFAYVFRRAPAWSRGAAPSPVAGFDYALFLACLLFSLDLAYAESRFHILGDGWQGHLLIAAAVFAFLAYRFDNRLVLSLALSSMAAWLGLKLSSIGLFSWEVHRAYALGFGGFCVAAGFLGARMDFKAHFLDVYLNMAAPFLGAALLSGVGEHRLASPHFYALAALCGAAAAYAFKTRKFVYLVWAALCGYAGITAVVLPWLNWGMGTIFLYFIVSSVAFTAGLFVTARRFKAEA
jgi:hypothetical protein